MNTTEQIDYLRDFVQCIRNYYALNQIVPEDSFTISKAMVSYAMQAVDQPEQSNLFDTLQQQRCILAMNDNTLTFSAGFLSGDNWVH